MLSVKSKWSGTIWGSKFPTMNKRNVSLLLLILVIGGIIAYALGSGLSAFRWLVLLSPLFALFLFAIWYFFFGWGERRDQAKVSGILLLCIVLIGAGIRFLTRYEGSTSGASMPKLVWIWAEKQDPKAGIETKVNDGVVDRTIEQEAKTVSTGFLGHDADGMWDSVSFSLDWEANPPAELWRRPIGQGWASFGIANGRAITMEQVGDNEQITCMDLLTGQTIWTQSDEGVNFVKSKEGAPGAVMGGEGPRSTPTIHDGKVYIMGSTGIAKCLDFETGNLIWKKNVITDYGGLIPKWGKSNSPLILPEEGFVIVTGSETKGVNIIALDLQSGEPEWTYKTGGASYSTPRIVTMLGTRQIISVNAGDVCGLDPASGTELWKYNWKGAWPKVGQPISISDSRILLTASYGVGSPLIELSKEGDNWSVTELWKSTRMKTKFSSAVILGAHAYGIDEGRLAAIDLATGNKAWKREKYGFGQQILVEDHLIIQTEPGDVVIGEPTPEKFVEKARIPALSSMTWNVPSLAGRFLLLRNDREAVCYLLPKKEL